MEQHIYPEVSKGPVQKRRELASGTFWQRFWTIDGFAAEQSAIRDRKAYRRSIERWENEGGAMLRSQVLPVAEKIKWI